MISLHAEVLKMEKTDLGGMTQAFLEDKFAEHEGWDDGKGWKNILNNLRLVAQPFLFWHLIKSWLRLFNILQLEFGFARLRQIMNIFRGRVPLEGRTSKNSFSSV